MHRLIEDHLEELLSSADSHGNNSQSGSQSAVTGLPVGLPMGHPALQHLEQCEDCRTTVEVMREQNMLLQYGFGRLETLPEAELEPAPGFYARVMERIEAQRPVSVWNLFFDSMWGRRLATCSLAMAVLLTGYTVSSEVLGDSNQLNAATAQAQVLPSSDFAGEVFTAHAGDPSLASVPSGNAVFASLVSYQER